MDDAELHRRFLALSDPTPADERLERQGQFGQTLIYVKARFVRARLNAQFGVNWKWEHSLPVEGAREGGQPRYVCKGRLTLPVNNWREDIGTGRDEKAAASDALKRCAAQFGVASDLQYPARTSAPPPAPRAPTRTQDPTYEPPGAAPVPTPPPKPKLDSGFQYAPIVCPYCKPSDQKMWDNRAVRKGNQPIFRCTKNRDHVIWINEWDEDTQSFHPSERTTSTAAARAAVEAGFPPQLADEDDDLPF